MGVAHKRNCIRKSAGEKREVPSGCQKGRESCREEHSNSLLETQVPIGREETALETPCQKDSRKGGKGILRKRSKDEKAKKKSGEANAKRTELKSSEEEVNSEKTKNEGVKVRRGRKGRPSLPELLSTGGRERLSETQYCLQRNRGYSFQT